MHIFFNNSHKKFLFKLENFLIKMLFYFTTLKLAWVLQKDVPVSREEKLISKYMHYGSLESFSFSVLA